MVCNAIKNEIPFLASLNEALLPELGEVLRDRGLAESGALLDLSDAHFGISEQAEHAQAIWVTEGPESFCRPDRIAGVAGEEVFQVIAVKRDWRSG